MTREFAVRALALYLPIVVAIALWIWRQSRPERAIAHIGAGVLLACAWTGPTLLLLHVIATEAMWWTFAARGGLFAGMPFDLYLGWIVLWGAVPALAFQSLRMRYVVVIMATIDLIVMPLCEPIVRLGPSWWIGEAIALAFVLVPAQCLARWTITQTRLHRRVALQAIAFVGWMVVLTIAIVQLTGGSWETLLARSARMNSALVQLLAIPVIVGLSAVQEFAIRGRGTPIPFDPPHQLVTTGAYAYVANPMQLAMALMFAIAAMMLYNSWILAASGMAVIYSAGIARWDEARDLVDRFGAPWSTYRGEVRAWWPRWRPYAAAHARLYVAQSCGTCRGVGRWFSDRAPIALNIIPAETHASRELRRITYEHADGFTEEGVAALARALEHLNLGWALLGMFVRLPVVRPFVQLLADASGGQPRVLTHRWAQHRMEVVRKHGEVSASGDGYRDRV